jgi:HK97 family phage prohead protease
VPWHLVANHSECGQGKWAVVKDADGSVTACHPSQKAARKHMAALYANEPGDGRGYQGSEEDRMAAVERRFTAFPVEPRAAAEGKRTIGGYAAVFNKPSQNLGGFIEIVTPTFFNRSRGQDWPDVMARFNHDDNMVLGTTRSRRLRLSVDDTGLAYDVDLPESYPGPYLYEMVRSGDLSKSSFAFRVPPDGDDWVLSDTGYPTRMLINGTLIDVAPVTQPAYLDSTVGLRSLATKFEAELDEVRSMAANDELRKFFVRTDGPQQPPKRRLSGAAALARVRERETHAPI